MKTQKSIPASLLLLLAVIGFSCEKIEEEPWNRFPEMTMTHNGSDRFQIGLYGTGTAYIDWGDGTPVVTDKTISNNEAPFPTNNHGYYRNPELVYTVKVKGKNITGLMLNTSQGEVSTIDVSKNPALEYLSCYGGRNGILESLDLSKNPALKYLDCSTNQLQTLDLSNNTGLEYLICYNNHLSIPDIGKLTELRYLDCSRNFLGNLDFSKNMELIYLNCSSTSMTALDLSKNTKLTELNCSSNKFSAEALNALFETLPDTGGRLSMYNNPGTDDCDRSIATNKGWSVNYY